MKSVQKIDLGLTGYDELFMNDAERKENKLPRIYDIPLSEIDDFPDHPFKVKLDEDMDQLVQSIKERGIITPVTLRPKEDGRYEIVSGHRRRKACELAGFDTVKAEVREMTRDEAIILMVESNLQRSVILPSEKAFSYKMRLEAMNRQGQRTDLTSTPVVEKLSGKEALSVTRIGNDSGESREQVRRYIRLTELIPELLDLVDEGRIAFRPAVELSYLQKEEQGALLEQIAYADATPSLGVALARELWGDRFQVVIATHCNTGHYHNHFVINSVSDVDGKKFYNSPADYRRMREVSDRLCREAKISVIEYPADRRANYGEWLAEKNGKPTMRSRIREDIDRAILASTTEREFQRVMKEMGYEVITKTPKGSPRVHPIVRIVDGGKNFRLDKLGEYYELDSIKQRIQNNYRRKTPFPEVAEDTKAPYYQYKEKAKKATGLHALYLYYCYELHIIVHKPASVKKVSAFLREDVTKLDRYIAQADFLAKTGIETVEALAGYKAEKEQQVEALTQQRTGLKNELKRHIRKEDFQSAEATRARIAELTAELKACRKEIALCTDIADRSEQVRKNLEQIEQQKIERKEKTENELLVRGSSRAGREDDAQRR